ncbi:MAG TPA: DUF4388 domain-containing protein, partial [Myxococcales bacterium]|nr:DUF4388 domain-containing protein [Myxococcales bacterium]
GAAAKPAGPAAASATPPPAGAPRAGAPVPKASPSRPTGSRPAVVAPPAGAGPADGSLNLDGMLKDISGFETKLPSEVLQEARRAAGLPDLPPPPPAGAKVRAIQAAPPSGRLEELSAMRLYYLVAAAEAGGKLTLEAGPAAVSIWFKQGTPQAVQSEAQGLGAFLVEQRALSAEALAAATQSSPADPMAALFASGQVNPSALFPLIQQHALMVLQRALLLDKGPFAFDPSQAAPPSGFPLGNRWEILLGAARRLDKHTLQRRLAAQDTLAPRLTGSTAELKLTAVETRLVASLDGSRPLAALIATFPAEAETLQRLVVFLGELDRISWQAASGAPAAGAAPAPARVPRASTSKPVVVPAAPPAATPPAPAAAASPPPASAPPAPAARPAATAAAPAGVPRPAAPAGVPRPAAPAGARPAAQAQPAARPPGSAPAPAAARPPMAGGASPPPRSGPPKTAPPATRPPVPRTSPPVPALKAEDPAKFLAALRQKNLFERLGFQKSATAPPTLKAVYLMHAKIYHPDMLPPTATAEQRKQCEDILALLNEANAVLGDDARRKAYLEDLEAQEAGVGDLDVEAILRAEEDFQRAVILIKGHKAKEGLDLVQACIKLNEKEGEFYAWRGYAKFLLAPDKAAAFPSAMVDIQKCLKLTPRCPPAHLLEASMAKMIGDDEAAQRAFKKVLELDPSNIEATRELRLYQQRAKKKTGF